MNKGADVLERTVIQAGKVFIKAGEENARAYMIQNGEVQSFTMNGDEKIIIEKFGIGTLIGEKNLIFDDPAATSYEAITSVTVVAITRQDFQKKLTRTDKTVKTVLDYAIKKATDYEKVEKEKAKENNKIKIDSTAIALVNSLTQGLSDEKKEQYNQALLPHVNGMLQEIKKLKS